MTELISEMTGKLLVRMVECGDPAQEVSPHTWPPSLRMFAREVPLDELLPEARRGADFHAEVIPLNFRKNK